MLLKTRRGSKQYVQTFELRFSASVPKFNANEDSAKLPQSLTSLTLGANVNVDSSQRISMLTAAATS